MTWLHFALLSVLTNGTFIFLSKRAMKQTGVDPLTVNLVLFIFAAIVAFPFFVLSVHTNPLVTAPEGWVYFLIITAINIFGFKYWAESISLNDLSLVGPLDNLRPFFVVVFSIFILGQKPTSLMLLGITFIVVGALAIQFKGNLLLFLKTAAHSRATNLIILSTMLFSLGTIFDKKFLHFTTPEIDTFLSLSVLVIIFSVMVFVKKRHQPLPAKAFQPGLIASGFLFGIGFLSLVSANKLASPNLVVPVMMTRSLYLAILGFVFLGEKDYLRKILSAVIMIFGVILLTR